MHAYISIDMEGVAGVATFGQAYRGGDGYPAAQRLMTAEANAAIAGAFDGGATEVTVNDSHAGMDNLLIEELDPRANVVVGLPKALCMMHGLGLGPEHDVALLIGYHAAAGEHGVLAHTFSDCFARYLVNGRPATEADVNAWLAARRGVPLGLVTGDDRTCAAAALTLPGVPVLEVKRAAGHTAANSLHPAVACERIREASRAAVAGAASLPRPEAPAEYVLVAELQKPDHVEKAALIPGVTATDALTVTATFDSPDDLLDVSLLILDLEPGRPW